MALWTQGDVVRRVQALLDDPAGRRFKPPYLAPYVDQEYEDILVLMERLGLQLQEQIAIFNVPAAAAAPNDLTAYFASGQPLQYLMRPKLVEWKLQGQPDTSYIPSDLVSALDDVMVGNQGWQQWTWSGGSIKTTPSYSAVTARITFDAMAPTLYDASQNISRGIGSMLALAVALFVASNNNEMGKLTPRLEKKFATTKRGFASLMVLQDQRKLRHPRSTKRGAAVQISAGGVPYIAILLALSVKLLS